jgi:hypothetical protein
MPIFTIKVVNETFSSSNEHEARSVDTATTQALRAALQIGTGEVLEGKQFFAAEVKVETANEVVGRFVVSIGASPLQIAG